MSMNRLIPTAAIASLLTLAACEKKVEQTSTDRNNTAPITRSNTSTPAPDNTARNKPDSSGTTKTPFDQSQSSEDVRVTADIRRAIMNEKSMSTNAQNCKIVTDKAGLVTLRGPVNTQAEKDWIETTAKAIAGVTRVDNQLEVKPV